MHSWPQPACLPGPFKALRAVRPEPVKMMRIIAGLEIGEDEINEILNLPKRVM
jgi:hypothetical protein